MKAAEGFEKKASELFRAADDLERIYAELSEGDAVLAEAVKSFGGMRLTKSSPWETTVCFIASQNNNIPRIKKIVCGLHKPHCTGSREPGLVERTTVPFVGGILQPGGCACATSASGILQPEELLIADLAPLKSGYREAYLKKTARMVVENGFTFDALERKPFDEARSALQELPGVGPKVADCILLYGFGRTEAFPVDVWIAKAMKKWYRIGKERQIQEFARERWGDCAGYAQLLLFLKARKHRQCTRNAF